ncbi:hypothetical protein Clacol_008815 [Clathrus columnatus]|uniref:Uncharacterized protein n=1 Tax=Clathrus columnatus TaxID=1419009 RepID=A0AAV5AJJ0_9AGAM|nr:hypothetical protein Clacol_008815 [Clathrus columnatus]
MSSFTFPTSVPFPMAPASSSLVPFPTTSPTSSSSIHLGPPPALPLPPLPSLPSPVSPEEQVAFVRASYTSNAGSVSSIGSMKSVNGTQSTQSVSRSKNGGGQSPRSISSSAASLRSVATGSSGSGTSVGTHTGMISNRKGKGRGRYASSVSEYEESILDVELDFESDRALEEDGDDSDEDEKNPKLTTSSPVVFSARTMIMVSKTSTTMAASASSGPPGSPSSAQSRSRTSSIHTPAMRARSSSRPRARINSTTTTTNNNSNNSSSNSTLRVRTFSQPSSPVPISYQARVRTISSFPPPTQHPNRNPDTITIPSASSYSTIKQNSKLKFSTKNPYPHSSISPTMSTSLSNTQHLYSSTPINIFEPTTPLTTVAFPPSTPQATSSDRSISPDLQTLLSHTSEVLKSGGKVRGLSRPPTGDRQLPDRERTSSTFSLGSKLSNGSITSSPSLNESLKRKPRSPFSTHAHDDGSSISSRNIHFGSTRPRSRLRSDSKSSLASKSSGANMKMGYYLDDEPTDDVSIATSSRVSLIDESFEDEKNLFEEGMGGEGRGDNAFAFFNPSSSFNTGEDDPTLTLSFPIIEDDDGEDMIDLKTPLPHLLLRAGVLSPNSKLLPRKVDSSDEEVGRGIGKKSKGRASPNGSVISSMTTTTTSSKHPRDARDTVKRRMRHKDGRLLRGGIGLTTGLGWSDSEDEDAPSEFTTRLKRLASMGGLSALSRKSSMASNMSGYGGGHGASMSNASNSGYGSLYGESVASTNGYAPSVSVSQSGSRGRTSTYADGFRGSVYSDVSYSGRYPNGTNTPSASSSRNVSRQSSFSVPYHGRNHSPFDSSRKEIEIVEEEVEGRLANKDKERGRKTASMVHVNERELSSSGGNSISDEETERENDEEVEEKTQKLVIPSSSSHSSSLSRQRNSTLSVSSTSSASSVRSIHSNALTLNPPSIAGSLTPTPETPTTPTPISSFGIVLSGQSASNSTVQSTIRNVPPSQPNPFPTLRQNIRLNTNVNNAMTGRSHSPVPPPSPAPTGPLPPTPGDVDIVLKGKFGRGHAVTTSGSGTSIETSALTLQSQIATTTTSTTSRPSSDSSQPRVISPALFHPARVTSPSFSMPTGSRTVHPARSRAGSLSSRESGYSIASVQTKPSVGNMGNGVAQEDKSRLPYVVEDDGDAVLSNINEKERLTLTKSGDSVKYPSDSNVTTTSALVLPSPIDSDAVAIIEIEPSEYGDDVAVAITGEEDGARLVINNKEKLGESFIDLKDNGKDVDIDSVRSSIPEYPYHFDVPPSPVTSVRQTAGSNGDVAVSLTGSFGFRKDLSFGGRFQTSGTSSSGLGKHSVSVSGSGMRSAIPSVAFSPTPSSEDASPSRQIPHHEHASSVSSIDTSESTATLFGAGRPDHMRMDSWNQSFSVFGSGMGVPPLDDTGAKTTGVDLITSSGTPKSPVSPPQTQASKDVSFATPSTSVSTFIARAASPMLARARAASPISSISSMRVGSSLGFASSNLPKPSTSASGRTTPSSQLGLTPSQLQKRGPSPVPSSKATTQTASPTTNISSKASSGTPIIPAPRKSSLPLPPSFSATPGRPTSPPPPPPSAAGHMPSLLLRPTAGIARKGSGGIPRPSHSTPTPTTSTATSLSTPLSSPSVSAPSSILSKSSTSPHSMLPQPGKRVGTPVLRYGTPGLSAGKRTS